MSEGPNVSSTRQDADEFTISQAPLAALATVFSDILLSEGHSTVRVLVRSNQAGIIHILQSVSTDPLTAIFVETASEPTALVGGEQVAYLQADVFGKSARVSFENTGGIQTAFEMSAYLLPEGSGGGVGAQGFQGAVGGAGVQGPQGFQGAAGGGGGEATLDVHGIIGSGMVNPSFGGTRQIAMIGNMGRKYISYAPQALTGARPGDTNWDATVTIGASGMATGSFPATADKLYEVASGLNTSWLFNAPGAYVALTGHRRLQPYLSFWMYWTTLATIANARVWFGMFKLDPTLLDIPGADTIALLFSDGINGNQFTVHAVDAAGTDTTQSTGIVVAEETEYFLELFHDDLNAQWIIAINGTEFMIPDADGPGGESVNMNFIGVIRRNKSGADTASLGCAGLYYEQS